MRWTRETKMKKMLSLLLAALLLCGLAAQAEAAAVDTSDWAYYTFEGSGVAMKLPPDFAAVSDEPEEGVFYSCGNADVILQVTPVEGDFADRKALAEYFGGLEYIVKAEPVEINGVEMVYVEGGDDCVTAYLVMSPEGTIYQFAFFPMIENADNNGVEVAKAMIDTVCSSDEVPGGFRTVRPMAEGIDPEALEDGVYSVSFDRSDLVDGVLNHAHIFAVDSYDIVDIHLLSVGDVIVIGGSEVPVGSLEWEDGGLMLNGGDADSFFLVGHDEDNCFRVLLEDDYPTYTDYGETNLALASGVVFRDGWDIEREEMTVEGAEEVARAIIESENEFFDAYNTTVRIESGKVVEIIRTYNP